MLFAAIILAAGQSSRMGTSKLLLPWGQTSVLGHLVAQWQQLQAAQIVVVHGSDPSLLKELDRWQWPPEGRIVNRSPERGMFSSVQCAAHWSGWKPGLTHWAFALGDQPHLRLGTLMALLQFAKDHPDEVCQPAYQARPKHPVILPAEIFLKLKSSSASTLKEFLRGERAALAPLDDPGLDFDLDYPEDYRRAKVLYFEHQQQSSSDHS